MAIFIYGTILGVVLTLLYRAASTFARRQLEIHRTGVTLIFSTITSVILVAIIVLLAFFKQNVGLTSISDVLSEVFLQAILGTVFGTALMRSAVNVKSVFHSVSPECWKTTGITREMFRYAIIVTPVALPAVAAVLLSGRITAIRSEVVSLEFDAITDLDARQLLVDLQDSEFQIRDTLFRGAEYIEWIRRDIDTIELAYPKVSTKDLEHSLIFHQVYIYPLFNLLDYLIRVEKQDPEEIREYTRQIGSALRRIVLSPHGTRDIESHHDFAAVYAACFSALLGMADDLTDLDSTIRNMNVQPVWPKDLALCGEIRNSPYIFIALSVVTWFNDNLDGATYVLEQAQSMCAQGSIVGSNSLEIYMHLGELGYYSGHPPSQLIKQIEQSIYVLDELVNNTTRDVQLNRIYSAMLIKARSSLAYFLAQEGNSQIVALKFAEDAYLSNPSDPHLIDTYGYVLMAVSARCSPPDFEGIARSRRLFEEALSFNHYIEEPVARAIHDISIRNHLRQSERLLVQRQ